MPELDSSERRKLARIAERIAAAFAANGWEWVDVGAKGLDRLYTPAASDVALDLLARIACLEPGERVDTGRIVVEWAADEEGPHSLRFLVEFGEVCGAEVGDPDA